MRLIGVSDPWLKRAAIGAPLWLEPIALRLYGGGNDLG